MTIHLRKLPFFWHAPHSSRAALLLAGCFCLLAGAGCGRGSWENDDGVPFTPHAAPAPVAGISLGTSPPPSTADDPLLPRGGGDPLANSADPLATTSHDSASADSRLSESRDLGSAKGSGSQTEGWYWVVGSIQSGQIGIAVNGTPIGRYSVHVDKEITAYCHPGSNTLTFTHYPLLGSDQPVCAAHLEILNGHAAKGTPPVMVYDTTADAAASTPAPAAAPGDPNGDGVLSPTGADSSGDPDTTPSAVSQDSPTSTSATTSYSAATPYSDERSFSAE